MRKYVSEAREVYEDHYHGLFSKKFAEWAIGNMKTKVDGQYKSIDTVSLSTFTDILKENSIQIDSKYIYTAWYLYNMAIADYPKALPTITSRLNFVVETLFDPDCDPRAVLECFVAKMCCMKVPIYWECYL